MKKIWSVSFIFLIALIATYISLPLGKFDLKLGLDLAGGSHLVFEADTSKIVQEKKLTALTGVRDVIERRVNLFGVSEPNVQISEFEGKDRIIVELPGVRDTKEATDLIGRTAQLIFAEVEDQVITEESTPSSQLVPTDLTGADLESAQVSFDGQNGKPGISLQFTTEGGKKFAEITKRNIGKPLPIILDGEILSAPNVQEEIVGGSAQISGTFTLEEAKKLSIQLNAGALPISLTMLEQQKIGPTLGDVSLKKSLVAGLIGFVVIVVFMVVLYGRFGIIAAIALLLYSVFVLAIFKVIPITLTLAGIAGFILSIGMAVDANILIFERMREELRTGKSLPVALELGFSRAWNSIRDANVSSLITSGILYYFGTGPIRGFAVTLAIGVVVSMFSAIMVTRTFLRLVYK